MKKTLSILTAVALMTAMAPAGASATMTEKAAQAVTQESLVAADRLLVKFAPGANRASVNAALGGKDMGKLGAGQSDWHVVNVPFGKVDSMKAMYEKNPNIVAVEYDAQMSITALPNDPGIPQQWAYKNVQASQAWDIIKGSNLTVAVIDTGILLSHQDLKGSLVPGKSFVRGANTANDDNGHGTHCAGSVAGIGNNGIGISGMDQTAKLMPVKVLNKQGSGFTSDIINGVYWATDNGAHVLSMSLGGGGYNQAFQDAINYAHGKNRIVVAAAGNDGTSNLHYPAAYNNVLSVAATDQNDNKTSWSTHGTWVDVAAPGLSIYSTWHNGGYNTISGTSMATPLVAGLASLTWGKNLAASNQAVIDRIKNTADATPGTGTFYKHGRVNAYKAVNGF